MCVRTMLAHDPLKSEALGLVESTLTRVESSSFSNLLLEGSLDAASACPFRNEMHESRARPLPPKKTALRTTHSPNWPLAFPSAPSPLLPKWIRDSRVRGDIGSSIVLLQVVLGKTCGEWGGGREKEERVQKRSTSYKL